MEITVEELQLTDLDAFWQVFEVVTRYDFPFYSPKVIEHFLVRTYTKAIYHYWLTTNWKVIFVAKAEGKIIGFAVIDKPYGGVCFLRWLGVLKEYRHLGAGKSLINAWLEYAKNYGCHKAELAAQLPAKEFYQKCGLSLEGERKMSYFGIDQPIFGKVLGPPKDEVMIKE